NQGCAGDCSLELLNMNTCVDYEMYNFGASNWTGSAYNTEGLTIQNFNYPFLPDSRGGAIGQAGLAWGAASDNGEDAAGASGCNDDGSGSCLQHIMIFFVPIPGTATGGVVLPATQTHTCTTSCNNAIPLGARIVLKSTGCSWDSNCTCPTRAS